ncbi:MAG: Uma2 family endonuclease [Planctomycetota bacterium]
MSASTSSFKLAALEPGDRMNATEFRRRDSVTSDRYKTELIEGVVHMAAAVRVEHGRCQGLIAGLLNEYCSETPGTDTAADATARLDEANEPQPDVSAFIVAECGGRTRIDDDGYLVGGPELLVEVSHATDAVDRGIKRRVYELHGVAEYAVWRIGLGLIEWYRLRDDQLVLTPPDDDGVYRSNVLPGFWLNVAAAVAINRVAVLETLRQGLASPQHATFVDHLARYQR